MATRPKGHRQDELEILFTPMTSRPASRAKSCGRRCRKGKWQGLLDRVCKGGRCFTARVVITPAAQRQRAKVIGFLLISKDIFR